jgi:hypothetical protein
MTLRKKKSLARSGQDVNLSNELSRFLRVDPKEMADAFERNKQRAEDIRRSAEERRKRLSGLDSGPKKQFSL